MRIPEPYTITQRSDTGTYQFTLSYTCGLPERVCQDWKRRSFQNLPDELSLYRTPKSKQERNASVVALISYLKKKLDEEGSARRVSTLDITVGAWIEKFTAIENSPRTGINATKNRSYSEDTLDTYRSYWDSHIKDDPLCRLKMAELEEEDICWNSRFCTDDVQSVSKKKSRMA